MSQTPEVLKPKQIAAIRSADEAYSLTITNFTPDVVYHRRQLLRHLDAREVQIREILTGLFVDACVVDSRGPITQDDILAAAQRLGITL